ncbi:hypothetical protein HF086_008041 [Spodoptera exigua]|uniref:Serine/threonine-protein kinase ATR n=1 Tax=Spodoptera exigua TaxID=7107 RepID=A0A922M208_SPOEX|nr:hypothetical protein HF086_008041 [Spodoptera exigua]
MDEDNQDGPFTVWQMFNAPTMVLFNNLEHAADGLDRLLTSILKLSGDFSEVLVPRAGSSKYPDSYYQAFNTWLVGRLFYVWSVEELSRIHETSKEAQLKILNILSMNAASFYNTLHLEYVSVLTKLVQYYKDNEVNQLKEYLLENFKSEQIDIPNVQLNLEPIYVKESLLKSLNVYYEKGEIDAIYLDNLNKLMCTFMKVIKKCPDKENKEILSNICTVILRTKNNKTFSNDLKLECLSMTKNINISKDLIDLSNKDATEIDILKEYYCKNILDCMNSDSQEKTNIDSKDSWCYQQVINVIESIKTCEDSKIDIFLISYHLKRCLSALGVLQEVALIKQQDKTKLISEEEIYVIWTSLQKLIGFNKSIIIGDSNCSKLYMDILLSSTVLHHAPSRDDCNKILQLLCLQNSPQFSEHNFGFNDNTKIMILKYIMIVKLILKGKSSETWNRIISHLISGFLKNKTVQNYKQKEVAEVISALACMSLGTYDIVITVPKHFIGHSIFTNNIINLLLICSKCHHIDKNKYSEGCLSKINQNKVVLYSESNAYTPSQHSTITSLKSLFVKFLNWKQYVDLKNSGFWNLFARLCHHYYVLNYAALTDLLNEENSDQVLKCFTPFVEDNLAEEDPEWNAHKDSAYSLCVNVLVRSTRNSLENNDYSQQTNTLNIIKEFGCGEFRDVCEVHGYTPNQVYHRYKKDYCKLFVECSLYSGKEFAISLLKVVRAFGFVGYRDFISKDVHHFLPYLMPYSVTIKEVPSMIEEIASLVQCSVSDFLIERFPHIYVHVYLNKSKEVEKKCMDIIGKLTKTSVLSLIKRHFRVILTEFLLQYCCDSEKVLNACRYLACHDPDVSTPTGSMTMSTSQIADFLNPKFLGVLAYFDHKLVNAKVAISVKRKALKSFPDIMQLMGVKYLTPLRFKVLATLRSALQLAKEFPKILAEAWSAFIHNIDTISLGPLMSNLAVSLLQQLEYAPQEINKIFHYLVLNNENLLSSHISDLFFLEDTNISDRIKMVIKRHVKRTQPDGFLDKIKWYLQHLNHDIPSIKAYAFSHLDKLLKSNRSEIHKAIFGGKNIDPVIVELIDSLLAGCKDPDPKVSLSSGACLGQLGAIEAGHLPRQYVQPDRSPFAFSIGDDCFAATALNMDCYALTIQEILKIYDISPTGSKKDVWDSFPEHMHQIMHPLLSSRYTLAYPSQPKKAHPLFGSTYATTFLEWAHKMTPSINSVQTEEGNQSKCSKTIYTLLDFLNRWLLEWCHSKQRPRENENYKAISSFLDKFDKLVIARGNFACGELERALQYLELYMDERKDKMQEQLPFLAEIYALLDEPDSVAGILSMKRSEPSLKELILAQVVTGRLQDAALCYERLAQEGQLDRHSLQSMIDCYLGLDQPFTAYRLLSKHDYDDGMSELSAEPLWRLGRFDELDELCKKPVAFLGNRCRLKELRDGDRQSTEILNQLLDEWRLRLSVVQSDVRTIEPLLRLRRILLQQTQQLLEPTHPVTASRLKACIGDLWLQSAKHARKAGIFQQSYMYVLNAEEYQPEELFIEKSKMYWARGQHEHAKICAKAKLLIAKYNDETTNVDVDVNIGYYKESVEVCLGAYYEKVSCGEGTSTSTTWSRRLYALNSYGKALQYGHKYLYQSMPRMLSIWLDVEVTSTDTSAHQVLAQMTEIIKTYSERLPLYLYLTAFSQIVSRICHPVKEVYLQLKAILVKLIVAYPQHTLWMMMSVMKSSYAQRIKRCADVFADPRLKEPRLLKLISDFTQLAEKLIELCNKPIAGSSLTRLRKSGGIYEQQLLPRHPPVFQEWFRRVFSDPYGWYQARSAYIRTTAVMSMVGYILGLGDRHGENISFDSTNGDTVHVDFNCLFNKGEAFEWPERVPFRLTHNMEAAMGPLKHEGMYRKSCEAVMRALRAQTAALMSVIEPFVYDPLVSWGKVRQMDCGERTNEQAMQHLLHIKQRLNGMLSEFKFLPLVLADPLSDV